jgi:hypothetical protein
LKVFWKCTVDKRRLHDRWSTKTKALFRAKTDYIYIVAKLYFVRRTIHVSRRKSCQKTRLRFWLATSSRFQRALFKSEKVALRIITST